MTTSVPARALPEEETAKLRELIGELPEGSPLAVLLQRLLTAARAGKRVTLFESDEDLTPNEAAEVLGMSRPHLLKLLDTGVIAFHRVGTHRRISMANVLDYIERRDRASAHVAHALGTREHALQNARDAAATFTDEELRELGMTR